MVKFRTLKIKEMKKKLIGYSVKPEFESQRKSIAAALFNASLKEKRRPCDFYVDSPISEIVKHLRVLNIWFDPVYEEEKPEKKAFTIGANTWMCVKGSGEATSSGFSYPTEEVREAILRSEEEVRIQRENISKLKELLSFMENK